MEKKSFLEKLQLQYVTPIIAIVTAIYSFGFTVTSNQLDKTTKEINNLKTVTETNLKEQEFKNNLRMEMYKEVKEAMYKSEDEKIKKATLLIVNSLLSSDADFKDKLTTLLLTSDTSKELIKTQKTIDSFENIAKIKLPETTYTIDVFYLEDVLAESEDRSKKICDILKKQYPKYNIRYRLLPKFVNAKSGYRIDSNQIRFEKNTNEEKLASDIKTLIATKDVFQKEQLIPYPVSNKTPNYISIFVRNM